MKEEGNEREHLAFGVEFNLGVNVATDLPALQLPPGKSWT